MRPKGLHTKIFLDSGDPGETREALKLLGFLDGQTTNPTLIAKNPEVKKRLQQGKKFSSDEVYTFYNTVVSEISKLLPEGSVSIEVYADRDTTFSQMLSQGTEMYAWIPNAHIKYPTTNEGLAAAEIAVENGIRVNMTLCFNQEQAAAVYAATQKSGKQSLLPCKNVFVSPFIGRLDDTGENGMDLIKNIVKMYKSGDSHVEVLAASVRTLDHFLASIAVGSDIITAPLKVLQEWKETGKKIPGKDFSYDPGLKQIEYQEISLEKPWKSYTIAHELTDNGIDRFAFDWNSLVSS